jgi:oxygen-independent coproporphyrinogen-3 oxidase
VVTENERTGAGSSAVSGIGLYLHVPYCLSRCPYCDFNTYAVRTWPEDEYAAAMRTELDTWTEGELFRGRQVETIFFGGGTPSLFRPATIGGLIEHAAKRLGVAADAEITIEANPGTVDREILAGFRDAGVNRLSFGVQSFDDELLERLGRRHSAEDARRALGAAREAGFDNLSLDLIYAIPGQDLEASERDVTAAIAVGPEHVSAYGLTYEKGTPMERDLAAGRIVSVDEEVELAMYATVRARLRDAGYAHYEVSNYARPGLGARHNRSYWCGTSYLGLGAGAHSFAARELGGSGWGARWSNIRDPNAYATAARSREGAVADREELTRSQAMGEACWLGLRQLDGLDAATFADRFGERIEIAFPQTEGLVGDGLLTWRGERLALTERGLEVADTVFASFF